MKINLAFSPCPNDTFIFDAIVNEKIDTEGLEFNIILADIEQLNQWSFQNIYDVTKLSYFAYTRSCDNYKILNTGSALGQGCGPILIKKPGTNITDESRVAIPGEYTTANFLLSVSYPNLKNKYSVVFSDIEKLVLDEKYDAGVIIHENRFTYKEKGLEKVQDLGEAWSVETNLPIPLGGIAISRNLDEKTQHQVDRIIKKSLEYSINNNNILSDYIKNNAQEIDEEIIKSHIDLYVNEFSLSLGDIGKSAINKVFEKLGIKHDDIYLDDVY